MQEDMLPVYIIKGELLLQNYLSLQNWPQLSSLDT